MLHKAGILAFFLLLVAAAAAQAASNANYTVETSTLGLQGGNATGDNYSSRAYMPIYGTGTGNASSGNYTANVGFFSAPSDEVPESGESPQFKPKKWIYESNGTANATSSNNTSAGLPAPQANASNATLPGGMNASTPVAGNATVNATTQNSTARITISDFPASINLPQGVNWDGKLRITNTGVVDLHGIHVKLYGLPPQTYLVMPDGYGVLKPEESGEFTIFFNGSGNADTYDLSV